MQKTTFQKLSNYLQQVEQTQTIAQQMNPDLNSLTGTLTTYNKTLFSKLDDLKQTFENREKKAKKDTKSSIFWLSEIDPLIGSYESYICESKQKAELMQGEIFYLSGTLETLIDENQVLRKTVSSIFDKIGDFESQSGRLKRGKSAMS